MKKLIPILTLLMYGWACPPHSQAQSFLPITSTTIYNGSNGLLTTGTLSLQAVNASGAPISYQAGGGGQQILYPTVCSVKNGAIAPNCMAANTAASNPLNVCFLATVRDGNNHVVLGGNVASGYGCLQPAPTAYWCTATSCNFDQFVPNVSGVPVARLPLPATNSLGGVFVDSCPTGQVQIGTLATGRPSCASGSSGSGTLNPFGTIVPSTLAQWIDATHIQSIPVTGSGSAVLATSPVLTTPTFSGTAIGSISGNAGTASALASLPASCPANLFAVGILANGSAICSTPPGGGNVSNSGVPTSGQLALWASATQISGQTMSGDAVISPGGVITVAKTGGVAFGPLATMALPVPRSAGGFNSISPGVGIIRDGTTPTASELSGDCFTSGSNTISCTKTQTVPFSGLATAAPDGTTVKLTAGVLSVNAITQAQVTGLSTALATLAPINNPFFTGVPLTSTPPTVDNSTKIANTAWVVAQGYAPLASPGFTGVPTTPTPATVDNSTKIANTAWVAAQSYAGLTSFTSPPPLGNTTPNSVAGTVINILGSGLFFTGQPTCIFGESDNSLDEFEDVNGVPMWLPEGSLGPCFQFLTYTPLPVGVNPTDKQVVAWDAASGKFTIQTQAGGLSAQGPNTVLANTTAGSALPTAAAIPSGLQNYVAATGYNQATSHQIGAALVCADSSASGTAQSCTTSPSFTPVANDCIIYTTTTANTGAGLTLNVNALGAKSVAKWQGTTTLAANDVLANKQVLACYDGTNWELSTVGNAPAGGSTPATSALWLPTATTGTPVPTTLAQTDSVANQLSCMQFTAPIQISPTKLSVVVQTVSVGQSFQVGIYDSSLNLVKDSGALSCNSGGGTAVTGAVSSFTLTPGATYYQCTAATDSTCAIMGVATNSNMTSLANKNATREFTCANALAAGALPATCGTQTAASQKRYLVLLEQ